MTVSHAPSAFPDARLGAAARIDRFVVDDGRGRGARLLRLVTGGGLEVEIHPDRAMDLGRVTMDGIPVAFMEPGGVPTSQRFHSDESGWLHAFGGGLLVTCGLESYGAPSTDEGRIHPQHGTVSGASASLTRVDDDGEVLVVEGIVREFVIGGVRLALRRRIEAPRGGSQVRVHDAVTNESAVLPAVHMMLYHINFGWPLLGPAARMVLPPSIVTPRDAVSAKGMAHSREIDPPAIDDEAEVFLHEFPEGERISVGVRNDEVGIEALVDFDRSQLPYLCEWKYLSSDAYVLGLEPMNTRTVTSRADAREHDALRTLAAGATASYDLTFRFDRVS